MKYESFLEQGEFEKKFAELASKMSTMTIYSKTS